MKVHHGDVRKIMISDLMWTIGTNLWKFQLRKIAWRNLWRSPKWNQKVVEVLAKKKEKKNQIPVFLDSIFLFFAQLKTKTLIQFFDARSASSCQVILFFAILFEHQFNNLIEFSEIIFFCEKWIFFGNLWKNENRWNNVSRKIKN